MRIARQADGSPRIIISEAQGPGRRVVVWVQGCDIGCKGCSNIDTWDSSAGLDMEPAAVAAIINELLTDDVDGLTFSGGEPFSQAPELIEVLREVKKDVGLFIFTGYAFDALVKTAMGGERGWSGLFGRADAMLCGPFNSRRQPAGFIPSENQTLELMTGRYTRKQFSPRLELTIDFNTGITTETGTLRNA